MTHTHRRTAGGGGSEASETDISRAIKSALVKLGCMVVRVQSGRYKAGGYVQGAEPGTPDLCVLTTDARTVWLEVKRPKGALSDEQRRWHAEAQRKGHRVAVVRSVAEALEAVR